MDPDRQGYPPRMTSNGRPLRRGASATKKRNINSAKVLEEAHTAAAAIAATEDDEDVVIVLDSPMRRHSGDTSARISRKSSFVIEETIVEVPSPMLNGSSGPEMDEVDQSIVQHSDYVGTLPTYLVNDLTTSPTDTPSPSDTETSIIELENDPDDEVSSADTSEVEYDAEQTEVHAERSPTTVDTDLFQLGLPSFRVEEASPTEESPPIPAALPSHVSRPSPPLSHVSSPILIQSPTPTVTESPSSSNRHIFGQSIIRPASA
jgi:hypothetical protein